MRKKLMELFFRKYVEKREKNRLGITIFYMTLLLAVVIFIGVGVVKNVPLGEQWKSILMVILGMLIGNFSKIMDYWFNSLENDSKLIDKVDEEDDDIPKE